MSVKDLTIIDLVAVELPGARAGGRQPAELGDVALGLVLRGELLQIVPKHLIQALVHGLRHPACLRDGLLVDGQDEVHGQAPTGRT